MSRKPQRLERTRAGQLSQFGLIGKAKAMNDMTPTMAAPLVQLQKRSLTEAVYAPVARV